MTQIPTYLPSPLLPLRSNTLLLRIEGRPCRDRLVPVDGRCDSLGGGVTRRLDAVEASSGGERRALGYLGEVLVEKHSGDELLA
jgi:hypothetical protein